MAFDCLSLVGPILDDAGVAGEIGHLIVDCPEAANICECGGKGHLSAVALGRGAAISLLNVDKPAGLSYIRSMQFGKLAKNIAKAYREGNEIARKVILQGIDALAGVLASVAASTGLARVVVVDGFAAALGDEYCESLRRLVTERCRDLGKEWDVAIMLGDPDGCADLLGAGRGWRNVFVR